MPYSIDMPYSSAPDAMAPSTKYFMADSAATPDSRSNATIAYTDSARSSTPTYTVSRLLADASTNTPSSAVSASTKYSPFRMPRRSRYVREYSNANATNRNAASLSTHGELDPAM